MDSSVPEILNCDHLRMSCITHGNTVKNIWVTGLQLNVVLYFSSDEVSRSLENFVQMQSSSFVSTMSCELVFQTQTVFSSVCILHFWKGIFDI